MKCDCGTTIPDKGRKYGKRCYECFKIFVNNQAKKRGKRRKVYKNSKGERVQQDYFIMDAF